MSAQGASDRAPHEPNSSLRYTALMAASNSTELFPSWLTRSKVTPVSQHVEVLTRPSLTTRLNLGLESCLTLLHAPAGFGKSTALANWRANLLEEGSNQVAWLSLEKDDNDPFQLGLYLAFSLHIAGVQFPQSTIEDHSEFSNLSARRLLSLLQSTIERSQHNVIMILDDFEQLEAHVIEEVIEPFIRYAPPSLHIAVAGRRDGALKITDLELRGLVNRLGAEDLKFSYTELEMFFEPVAEAKSIQQIYTITEGWPVAVQLLRRVIKADRDLSEILAHISSDKSKLADYLSEQVFDQLDEEKQSFLMDVSIHDRIDCDFADFLREAHSSSEILTSLKDLDALLTPIDKSGLVHRLHPIFREYLLDRLTSHEPDRSMRLHVRAGQWFNEQGDLLKAVRYFVEGGNQGGAADCIEAAGGLMMWLKEGLTRLPRAMALLDEETIRSRPRLCLVQCMLFTKTGQALQARQLYDDCVRQVPPGTERSHHLKYELAVTRHLLHAYGGQGVSEETFRGLEEATERIPASEHALLGHHYTVLCGLNAFRASLTEAHHYANRAISAFRSAGSKYGETYIYVHLGDLSYCQGSAKEAEGHYKVANTFIRRHFSDDKAMRLVVDILQAELRYDANRLDLIPKVADQYPRQLQKLEAWFNIHAAACELSSNLAYVRSGLQSALSILDAQKGFAKRQGLSALARLLVCQKARLMQRAGRFEDSALLIDQSGIRIDSYRQMDGNNPGWRERDIVAHAMLRQLIVQDELAEALAHLNWLIEWAASKSQVRSRIKYLILRTLVYRRLKEKEKMFEDLRVALVLSHDSNSIRGFLDEGEIISSLIHTYIQEASGLKSIDKGIEFARLLVEQFNRRYQPNLAFTERELQILQELKLGHANKVIARNIGISHNTVRYHLKNAFAKLNVSTRLQAVAEAQARKII